MCTAITYKTKDHYFGRNLDLDHTYRETVTITPRNYPFHFRFANASTTHHAMIGMATVADGYPLYYEATNEHGLSIAGLNFPGSAVYSPLCPDKINIAPFEFIPWILCRCISLEDVRRCLRDINIADIPFSEEFALTPLHWIISDKVSSITVEPGINGPEIFENSIGVLTNSPPFAYHMHNLCNYLNLTSEEPVNRMSEKIKLEPYSRGMGAIGLPGDLSSSSRFIKAAFTKLNSVSGDSEQESISQFFHILNSVAQQRGCVRTDKGYEITVYSCCCNTDRGIYYYTTYENSRITAVCMFSENLDTDTVYTFPLAKNQQINIVN